MVWIGDDAFPNKQNLLKPYPKNPTFHHEPGVQPEPVPPSELKKIKVFNYRLSRARMVVECAFGILASHFCFLTHRITCHPDLATGMIKAACVLHNFFQDMGDPICRSTVEEILAEPRQIAFTGLLQPMQLPRGFHTSTNSREVKDIFKEYFSAREGALHWQNTSAAVDDL